MMFNTIEEGKEVTLQDYIEELNFDVKPTIKTCFAALEHGEDVQSGKDALEACLARWDAFDKRVLALTSPTVSKVLGSEEGVQ